MKLKALIISHPLTKDVTDMKWLQEIEEQANVEIEWEQIRADWETDAYFAEDSQVKNYAVDERYKLFMKYIADLYADGLINQNALTNDYSAFQSLSRGNENGDAIVGCVFGWEETDKFGPTLYTQYTPVPALEYDLDGAAGTYDTRWRNDYTGLNMAGNRVCMSAKCSNPETAMKFIDLFYDSAVSVQGLFGGITDGCVEQTGDNSFKVLDPLDPDTDPGTWKWTSTMADNAPMYIRRRPEHNGTDTGKYQQYY